MPRKGDVTAHDACPACSGTRFIFRSAGRARCGDCGRTFNPSEALIASRVTAQAEADAIRAARKGWAPDFDMVKRAAPGFMVKGTSTLYRDDGTVGAQWVKTTADQQAQREALEATVQALCEDLPQVKPRKASGDYLSSLLTAYPIGDPHFGMLAWPTETGGAAWDLAIAERTHCEAMAALVQAAPASEQAVVINLGDALHQDSLAAVTPRSGHNLDSDGRYAKMAAVATKVLRQCIETALTKHKRVHVICAPGNHDETGALWLSLLLAHTYEREPRVTVETSPSVFLYYRWGKVLLGIHHGHTCKADKLPGVMAADRAKDWGETAHRHWLVGHIHHASKAESAGATVESFNTLAARDAYATNGGWRSARTMSAIVYHREHGEVGRSRVCAEMFEHAEAQ